MHNYNHPRKRLQPFELTIPMTGSTVQPGSNPFPLGMLTIIGISYFFPNEEKENQFDYDIDGVLFNDTDVLPVLKWMEGSAKEITEIDDYVMAHIPSLFLNNEEHYDDPDMFESLALIARP